MLVICQFSFIFTTKILFLFQTLGKTEKLFIEIKYFTIKCHVDTVLCMTFVSLCLCQQSLSHRTKSCQTEEPCPRDYIYEESDI